MCLFNEFGEQLECMDSAADGTYVFMNLESGTYYVETHNVPVNLVVSVEQDGSLDSTIRRRLAPGQCLEELDVGFRRKLLCIFPSLLLILCRICNLWTQRVRMCLTRCHIS